jgi:glycosyltransferase involved in cell wall biosynthesis
VKKKILVRGPVLSQSGYGEQARFALRALRSREDLFDIYVQPIRWGQTGWIWEDSEERRWMDDRITKTAHYTRENGQMDVSLQITIPNEWEDLAAINIGYTAGIESDKVSPTWLYKANQMNKIIVVSDHSRDVYAGTTARGPDPTTGKEMVYALETPITSVGYAVRETEALPIEGFDPKTNFNFLCVSQWGPRKNFHNTIKWWVEEFHDQKVGLILKTSIANNSLIDKAKTEELLKSIVEKYENRKCKIYMLHGDLSDGQMKWLYQHEKVKCLVNIAHGEGFGLPMFEAAQNALPVMTVGYSGQMDYLNQDGKSYYTKVDHTMKAIGQEAVWNGVLQADSRWAYAEQGSYKMQLRKMRKGWKTKRRKAEQLQVIVNKKYTEENMYKQFCDSIIETITEK